MKPEVLFDFSETSTMIERVTRIRPDRDEDPYEPYPTGWPTQKASSFDDEPTIPDALMAFNTEPREVYMSDEEVADILAREVRLQEAPDFEDEPTRIMPPPAMPLWRKVADGLVVASIMAVPLLVWLVS